MSEAAPLPKGRHTNAGPRRTRALVAAGAVACVTMISIGVGASNLLPSPTPEPTSGPGANATAVASPSAGLAVTQQRVHDGVRLTVTLDPVRIVAGEVLFATATAENVSQHSRFYPISGDCEWATQIVVEPLIPLERGLDWDGNLAQLKRSLLGIWGTDYNPHWFVSAERLPTLYTGCFPEVAAEELPPGASKTDELAWRALGPLGMPLASGAYDVVATFNRVSSYRPQENNLDSRDVTLTIPIEVEGPDVDYLDPGEAVDVVFSDSHFRELVTDVGPGQWLMVDLEFRDERWVLTVPIGEPGAIAYRIVAEVDAVRGEIVELRP